MNGWILLIVIAGGIVLAFVIIVFGIPIFASLLNSVAEKGAEIGYARAAKKQNEEALRLRLERKRYDGWPLPEGKEGELRITQKMQLELPAKSYNDLDRIYKERARDLGVDISILQESWTQDLIVQWHPSKEPVRKPHY